MQFVTSWGNGGFAAYGKRMVESFTQMVPWAKLLVYVHDDELPTESYGNVEFQKLDQEDFKIFMGRSAPFDGTDGGTKEYDYKRDAKKFSPKVFAMVRCAEKVGDSWFAWLDADTEFTSPLPEDEFRAALQGDLLYMGRQSIDYIESSFICFNLASEPAKALLKDLYALYVTGELFTWREFHDGYAITRLIFVHLQHGLKAHNITPQVEGLDAFSVSFLGKYAKHYKGNKKTQPTAGPPQPERHLLWLRTPTGQFQPLRVVPRDAAPKATISANVAENSTELLKVWLTRATPHGKKGIIVASGPSLPLYYGRIKKLQAQGAFILCVKHALPYLIDNGITPDGCIILEARPLDGISTHNVKRRDLYAKVTPATTFFVGSMSDPDVTKLILEKGCPVVGWHALTDAAMQWAQSRPGTLLIAGGTCSAIRAVGVLHTLGFRDVDIYGVDACRLDEPTAEERQKLDDGGRPWWLEARCWRPDGKSYWTSGEMLALAQDIVGLAQASQNGNQKISFMSPLLAGEIWNGMPRLDFLDDWRMVLDTARQAAENKPIL